MGARSQQTRFPSPFPCWSASLSVGDGDPLVVLEGEDAGAPLALPHVAAPGLDPAVGSQRTSA